MSPASWSVAATGAPMSVPAAVFSATARGVAAPNTGEWSSSSMVRVTSAGSIAPWSLLAFPLTVTVLGAASTSLSSAVMVSVPLLVSACAAMVSTVSPLNAKSPACAGATGAAETRTVVSALDRRSSVAVTTVAPPSSAMASGARCNVTAGVSSSSLTLICADRGGRTLRSFSTVAANVTVVSGPSTSSSTQVISTGWARV